MSKTPPNLADLSPEVQAFVAAQAAELARKDAEILGLSLRHAAAQERLKGEAGVALAVERTGLGCTLWIYSSIAFELGT